MANPHKGEVAFDALGKSWTMRLAADEICNAEAALDLGIEEILDRMQRGSNFRIARIFLVAGLNGSALALRQAADRDARAVTFDQANEMIEDIGLKPVMELVATAIQSAFPPPAEKEKDARPPKGVEAGTGKPSAESGSP